MLSLKDNRFLYLLLQPNSLMVKKKHPEEKRHKFNFWIIATIILSVTVIVLAYLYFNPQNATSVGEKTVNFINENIVQGPNKASLVSVEEESGMFKVTTSYQGQNIPVYVSKDGKYLFLSQPIDMTVSLPKEVEETKFDAPNSDKPKVDLYVMSFCPFGIQAENAMKPVFDLLKNKAEFNILFIANVNGEDYKSVDSLHGLNEALENLRQICVMKYYDQTTFWKYLMEINANCFSVYRDEKALDACWRSAAKKFNIDDKKIDECSKSKEALEILKQHENLVKQNKVRGSPTLIINGKTYNGPRTPEAFKEAICTAFNKVPAECSTKLEGNSTQVTGSC
ncbi:MAG: thioredoxin domain-containing protein [Candidatus Aenigmarchaeota archaeon]|nr:thioredoxin domain-containing protein [Candidatus Aenigmarchaeota archaeon]MCX8179593.1 thioredoxin domain-containing protein [Candidatus Aenigmarchaeota archaeon]